jgi:DNA-binding GntR family transcriptional regulator
LTIARPAKLASRIRDEVRDRIRDGRFPAGYQLPAEVELGTSLGVSRTTIREALLQLEQEGLLIRRHGHGTFVRPKAILRGSLNDNLSSTETIRSQGMEPGTKNARLSRETVSSDDAARLQIGLGSEVLVLERVRTADSRPVIFTVDTIPVDLFDAAGVDPGRLLDPALSLFQLYADQLGRSITDGLAFIRMVKADDALAIRLETDAGTPILCLEQVDSDVEGNPVLLSREYYVADTFEFTVYRRGPALPARSGARDQVVMGV